MKYMVIEPHADDAFLSLGGHIKRWIKWGDEVEIVTVYGTPKRAAEAEAYAHSVGASHSWMGYEECGSMDGTPAIIASIPAKKDWAIICPLGLRHAEHYAVTEACDYLRGESEIYDNPPLFYYVDQPYAMQLKNQDELQEKSFGKKVISMYKPGGRKYDKKTVDIFKTQSLFFFYNKDILPHTTEIILW